MKKYISSIFTICLLGIQSIGQTYYMPGEDLEHEGTWLQWPHNELYGPYYQDDVEQGWITMTNALQVDENVHIIAYNNDHQTHIISRLSDANVPMTNIDFHVMETNDVWVRDNGPFFVYDENNTLTILDFGFNGWGNDTPYEKCDLIPQSVSNTIGVPRVDLSEMVLEGGSIEHDGNGTMIATRSCIVHPSRNPDLSEEEIENYMADYLGFEKFIWLDGVYGQDITDHHVDGFLKFANDSTIVTMNNQDLSYWLLTEDEINTVYDATNIDGIPYTIVTVPLTQNNVETTYGDDLGMKGSYCNYYIANGVVLVPVYNDPNDQVALDIIQSIYPNRTVVGVNVQNLYEYGGMTHCVTQQQPVALATAQLPKEDINQLELLLSPVPSDSDLTIQFHLLHPETISFSIVSLEGKTIMSLDNHYCIQGTNNLQLPVDSFPDGTYFLKLEGRNSKMNTTQQFIIQH